jgi:outer membrane lipoprotein SlyB
MTNHRTVPISLAFAVFALAGCQAPGANLEANVYRADQVNTRQEAKVVNILAVMPAKVEVDNKEAQKTAEVVGGLLGAVGGGIIGNNVAHHSTGGTALGVAGGGIAGAAAGSLVPGKVLVDGVSLTYEDQGKTFNSAQVGKPCEFAPGKAVVIATSQTETRIQPNTACPAISAKS